MPNPAPRRPGLNADAPCCYVDLDRRGLTKFEHAAIACLAALIGKVGSTATCGSQTTLENITGAALDYARALMDRLPEPVHADQIQVFKDTDGWCATIGDCPDNGIGGFADTPAQAVINLTKHQDFSEWSNNLH